MRRTPIILLLLAMPCLAQQRVDPDPKLILFLQQLAVADGGYLAEIPDPKLEILPRRTLGSTSSAMRAENYLTGTIRNAHKHSAFILSCFDNDTSGFAPYPGGKPDVQSTAIGLMAMAELGIVEKTKIPRAVEYLVKNAKTFEERRIAAGGFEAFKQKPDVTKTWIAELRKTANPDGTYGDGPTKGRSTGGAVAFILRMGGELTPDEKKAVVAALQDSQQADGCFIGADGKTTDLEATYRIMRAFYLLKEKPKDLAKLSEYLRKCQNTDGGFGRKPGEKSSGSGTYYFASISKWIKVMESAK